MSAPLKLTAQDTEDLEIISSCLQDAIIPISEMAYRQTERCFVFVSSRFGWEGADDRRSEGGIFERINCAVRFNAITSVRRQNIDQARREAMLSLLAIQTGQGYIDLIFSGGGTIRLTTERIDCQLDDLEHRWPTRWRPSHERD